MPALNAKVDPWLPKGLSVARGLRCTALAADGPMGVGEVLNTKPSEMLEAMEGVAAPPMEEYGLQLMGV